MKRLIKYYNVFKSDDMNFSDCGTKYEVLPVLVSDDKATSKELRKYAKLMGINIKGRVKSFDTERSLNITHSVNVDEVKMRGPDWNQEKCQVYLGFINIKQVDYIPLVKSNGILTDELMYEVLNNQDLSIRDLATFQDGSKNLILESWDAYHHLDLMGYNLKEYLNDNNIDTIFEESCFQCGDCGVYDYSDDGYTYNYRMTDNDILGINCGCYTEYGLENYKENANDADISIELDVAIKLKKQKKLKHVARYIGGMVDGRGGYFDGEYCSEGTPQQVLNELLKKYPKRSYVFSHDESGQFQTYFSVWQVLK